VTSKPSTTDKPEATTDKPEAKTPPSNPFTLQNLARLGALSAPLVYAALFVGYRTYYAKLGINPEDLGISTTFVLVRSIGFIALAIAAVALVASIVGVLETMALSPESKTEPRRACQDMAAAVVVNPSETVAAVARTTRNRVGRTTCRLVALVPLRPSPAELATVAHVYGLGCDVDWGLDHRCRPAGIHNYCRRVDCPSDRAHRANVAHSRLGAPEGR